MDIEESNVRALPHGLKTRLSSLWNKCLEMLSTSTVPACSVQRLLNEARFKTECERDLGCESWEELLLILSEDDAVLKNGHLLLQPIFLSLPITTQSKLISLVFYNMSKICSHQLEVFVSRLEQVEQIENPEISCCLKSLRQYLLEEASDKIYSHRHKPSDLILKEFICDILHKHKSLSRFSSNQNETKTYTIVSETNSRTSPSSGIGDRKVVEVIVINDEDSLEFQDLEVKKQSYSETGRYSNCSASVINPQEKEDSAFVDLVFPYEDPTDVISPHSKRKAIEIDEQENLMEISPLQSDSYHELKKKIPRSDVGSSAVNSDYSCHKKDHSEDKTGYSSSQKIQMEHILEGIKIHLQKLKEAFSVDNSNSTLSQSKLKFLLELSPREVEASCNFLCLGQQNETTLIKFCDAVPWSRLQIDMASTLFNSCFLLKMTTLQEEVSQTLLAALTSVLNDQPNIVLDLFIKVIAETEANDVQCELLATVCKKSLSQEALCYLIRQLSERSDLVVNESLCSVLQAIIDIRADLDPLSLTSLLKVLAHKGAAQSLTQSQKMGKCLMACLTKYGKKMTREDLAIFAALVDVHGSSFKVALRAGFKRFNK